MKEDGLAPGQAMTLRQYVAPCIRVCCMFTVLRIYYNGYVCVRMYMNAPTTLACPVAYAACQVPHNALVFLLYCS